ncbi:MAG TPA: hypothetical protein VJ992_15625 [Gemmatimonadales bacterium]|nr:hypothetical protein [Gemmatimonadales bacterium]
MRRIGVLGAAVVVLAACVSTNAVQLAPGAQKYPAVPADSVQVFLAASDIHVPYEKLALINASGASGWTDEEGMINAMRKKAGKLGANAIVLENIKEPSAGAKVAAALFGGQAERKGEVIAIRLHPEEAVQPPPSAKADSG